MKNLLLLGLLVWGSYYSAAAQEVAMEYDSVLAKKLGADERGMRKYVLAILKTGPYNPATKEERDSLFQGHFANIGRLAKAGQLSVAGPFMKNDKQWRGLYLFNVESVEEAEALAKTDPAVKAGVFVMEYTPWYGSAILPEAAKWHDKLVKKGR